VPTLARSPRDDRALSGLRDCLNARGRKYEAEPIDKQFRAAWKVADVALASAGIVEKTIHEAGRTCCAEQAAFFSAIMLIERRQLLATRISWTAAICLTLASFFITSCNRSAESTSSPPTSGNDTTVAGAVLRADPNPVPGGSELGKTTISWDTGSDAVGEVYVGPTGNETIFASGPKGSQDAPWIKPGSTEFRLYHHADHKLLAQLTVTMPSSNAPASNPSATPISSDSP
jgi:hypothetical protein